MEHVEVTFRNLEKSDSLEREIHHRAEKLGTYCSNIVACRVLVSKPHRHKVNGTRFSVHIDVVVPGEEIAVSHSPDFRKQSEDGTRKDVRTVVRDAFAAAKRQLQDYARRRRLEVKAHTARIAVART
jgi:ribosome-associated translation inhibitor RaiA